MNLPTLNRAKSVYFAQPYSIEATGFYFETFEEYEQQARSLKDRFGQPVEEFELQYIDGEQYALFKALEISQATLALWFDTFADLSGDAYLIATHLAEYGYDIERIPNKLEDFHIHHGTASDYAAESLEETADIPDYLAPYIDYDAVARDMIINGEIEEIDHQTIIIGYV